MSNVIHQTFGNYANIKDLFEKFHNQVINMPRDAFSTADLHKLQSIAAYLLLIENKIINTGNNYKVIMELVRNELRQGNYPVAHRNGEFESRYFTADKDINQLYAIEGRMFRHLMGLCAFFGVINSASRRDKVINFDACKELVLSEKKLLIPIFRNNLLSLNIKNNDYINNLAGISISPNADYRPAYAIIRYIKELNRPATMFEVSILLGRIDDIQTETDIIRRALNIGTQLPQQQEDQIKTFFGSLGWKADENHLFEYSRSQEPYFKFRTFILYMNDFHLIEINSVTNLLSLTEYSENLLSSEVPIEIADLHDLLDQIDDDKESDSLLADIIIRKRSSMITLAIKSDSELVKKMNLRSLRKVKYNTKGQRKRNPIIAELAKIMTDYTCEVTDQKTFRMPNGTYYVEAHHIIEFSTQDGPDITDNLLVLGPEKHKLIHHACIEERDDLHNHLKTNGKISYTRFENMHRIYNCLKPRHVKFLYDMKLISKIDRDKLLEIVTAAQSAAGIFGNTKTNPKI